jgi:hypothetical protein
MSARDAVIDADNLARIQEIAFVLSAKRYKPLGTIALSVALIVAAYFLWDTPLYVPAILASIAVQGWGVYSMKQIAAPPERVFELLAAFEPITESSRYELEVLQNRLKQGSQYGDTYEITRWYKRELGLSVDDMGGVRTHFRDVFFSKELGRRYRPTARLGPDECQVLPMVKKDSSNG